VLEPEGPAAQRDLFEQRLGEAVVVVAGDQHDPPAGHRLAELLEEGLDDLQHLREGQLAQLEHVAEQDEAVGSADLVEQDAANRRVPAEVLAGGAAEVQVGDDRGAHPRQPRGLRLAARPVL
jgi:hypothetical protein